MKDVCLRINEATIEAEGKLRQSEEAMEYRTSYRKIIAQGEKESPEPLPPPIVEGKKKKPGKLARSKERNLLERLRDFERETLLFMTNAEVPFTNNRGENDLRMTKVQQKVSGCFRSVEGAEAFCRVRSYLLTSQKHGINATDALTILFDGKLPDFCSE